MSADPPHEPDPDDYGRWLRLREGRDQRSLASIAGVPVAVVSDLDNRRPLRRTHATALADVLRISPAALLAWAGTLTTPRRHAARPGPAGQKCAYCPSRATTWDHIVPRSRGGSDDPTNLLPACLSCNARRQARLIVLFAAQRRCPRCAACAGPGRAGGVGRCCSARQSRGDVPEPWLSAPLQTWRAIDAERQRA